MNNISIIYPISIIILPLIFLSLDITLFSISGITFFLTTLYTIEIIKKDNLSYPAYLAFFIISLSFFKETFVLDVINLTLITSIGLYFKRALASTNLACYLIITGYWIVSTLANLAILGLKNGFLYTLCLFFANIILVYFSLKFLARYNLGDRV